MACVADIYADMRDLRRGVVCHLRFSLFSTRRTINSSEKPLVRTKHANQRLFRTVAFGAQYADGRLSAAKWARRWSSIENLNFAVIREIFGVGLKKNPGEHSIGMSCCVRIIGLKFGVPACS